MPGLTLDHGRRSVGVNGNPVEVTPSEFTVLAILMSQPGDAVPSTQILLALGGGNYQADAASLHVLMSRLRRKLGEAGLDRGLLRSVRGFGYRFDPWPSVPGAVELRFDADLILRSVAPHAPFLGWEPDEIIGTFFSPMGLSHELAQQVIQARLASGSHASTLAGEMLSADGHRVPVQTSTQLILDEAGNLTGVLGLFSFTGLEPGGGGQALEAALLPVEEVDADELEAPVLAEPELVEPELAEPEVEVPDELLVSELEPALDVEVLSLPAPDPEESEPLLDSDFLPDSRESVR